MSPENQDILDESIIRQHCLPFFTHALPQLVVRSSIDSTNQYLKDLPVSSAVILCCADTQTNGRGRLGRTWYSPAGVNIYCSIRWHLRLPLSKLPAISLIVALAILDAFKTLHMDADIQIKWPKMDYHLSARDKNAPTLDSQVKNGLLPCQR
jgi:BirA family biotin operon repressor/biotin-[acetyl-CoA-carboxylase] ligase